VLKKYEIEKPTPIQAQALPAIMSGRDVIGIAKTGSGKTLAYLLPLIRHILDQPPRTPSDGPIALIMAPTHELVIQINDELKKFKAATGIRSTAVYGGAGVASQIGDLKRGVEVVVCTPGRMIDLLCKNKGRITNLKRVTCVVLDEADRMFDMGFESQIRKIIANVRPDRQVVMFSATFPRVVETAARSLLHNPLELTVQGKTIVADTIDQFVEVLTEEQKLSRSMELISSWYDKGSILIFVDTQQAADLLFRDIIRSGYACVTLHGGKEQIDRESTISDFRRGHVKIMIATSVAARGLDVPSIRLVLNYDVPNHLQDYIHRVGRTGRAGNHGTAITFITPEEDQYSPDLVKALKNAKVDLPVKLEELHNQFQAKLHQGTAKRHAGGYVKVGGLTKLTKKEDRKRAERKLQMKMLTGEDYVDSDEEVSDGHDSEEHEKMDQDGAEHESTRGVENNTNTSTNNQMATIEMLKQKLNAKLQQSSTTPSAHCVEEFDINEYPQNVLYRVTNKDALRQMQELTGCNVTKKGLYVAPGRKPPVGERKLYLLIEGANQLEVQTAKSEIKKRLEEAVCNVYSDRIVERRFSVV
jgi:ATP-dependent RNA helicase DDX46/PRP5